MRPLLLLFFATVFSVASISLAASSKDVDRLTSYAVILGRGIACGAESAEASRRVGAWMDVKFPPGSQDQKTYLPIFMQGVLYHAQQQKEGKSPDSCTEVLHNFRTMPWP